MRWSPLLLLLLAPSLATAWPPNGARLTGAIRPQVAPMIASDGVGGAFVAWQDQRDYFDPLNYLTDLYLQRVTLTGQIAPGWPSDGLAVATGPGFQFPEAILPDGNGGLLIAYGDDRLDFGDIHLQRITAAGTVAPGWPSSGVPIEIGRAHV